MKKLLFFVIIISFALVTTAQETKKSSPVSFAGGLIVSTNQTTTFIGFMGPKVSVTLKVTETFKAELAINGFPGLILKPELKPVLALGSTLTLKRDSWKLKPVVGLTLLKTTKWQPMIGVGFVF